MEGLEIGALLTQELVQAAEDMIRDERLALEIPDYAADWVEQFQDTTFQLWDFAHQVRDCEASFFYKQDSEPVRLQQQQLPIPCDTWVRQQLPTLMVVQLEPDLISEVQEEEEKGGVQDDQRSTITRLSLKRRNTILTGKSKKKSKSPNLLPATIEDRDANEPPEQLEKEARLRALQEFYEKQAKEDEENRKKQKEVKKKRAKQDRKKAKAGNQFLTYDSDGRILVVKPPLSPTIFQQQKRGSQVRFDMPQQVKLKKKFDFDSARPKKMYEKDPEFFKKVQKYHGIQIPQHPNEAMKLRRHNFVTSIHQEENFQHPRVRARQDNVWNVKPGVVVKEDGHVVRAGGKVEHPSRLNLDTYAILLQKQQEGYRTDRLSERTGKGGGGGAQSYRERFLRDSRGIGSSLTSLHARRTSAAMTKLPPIQSQSLQVAETARFQRPDTGQSIATARTLLTEAIREEDAGELVHFQYSKLPTSMLPETHEQKLKRVASGKARLQFKRKSMVEGRILREIELLPPEGSGRGKKQQEKKTGTAVPYSARGSGGQVSPFKQRRFSRESSRVHLPAPPVGRTLGHGILK